MRTRIVTVLLGAALAFLLVTHPVVAEAARKITGRDIKNNSVTSADIRNGSLTGKDVKNQGLTGGDIKIDTLKHLFRAKALVNVAKRYLGCAAHDPVNRPLSREEQFGDDIVRNQDQDGA